MAENSNRSLLFFMLFVFCGGLIFYTKTSRTLMKGDDNVNSSLFVINTLGCYIPYMNTFDPSIIRYIFKKRIIDCNNGTSPLIESNLTHLYWLEKFFPSYGIYDASLLKCCYYVLQRKTTILSEGDLQMRSTKYCVPFNHTSRIHFEFVKVICSYKNVTVYKDLFSFVPVKTNLKRNLHSKTNVLIIGIDSVSRLNFHRQMPKTLEVLKNMNAVEFLGYNKIGYNTCPNLIAMLMGLNEKEIGKTCWSTNNTSNQDRCHFIWQNYKKVGYVTAFVEDAYRMGLFNCLKRDFKNQTTDYYWNTFKHYSGKQIGNHVQRRGYTYLCVDKKMVYSTLLKYMMKFITTMNINSKRYFGFFWSSSLTQGDLNSPQLADSDYARVLNELRTNGVLNDTVTIFMSGHGVCNDGIRYTSQGVLEEKLPLLFISLPEAFIKSHRQAYSNLRQNTERLTTPYDLHATLNDLLDLYNLTSSALNKRQKTKRYYSLFESIPQDRTCNDAGIASHWCACESSIEIDKNGDDVKAASRFAVRYINEKVKSYAYCAQLTLFTILNVRLHTARKNVLGVKNYFQDYTILFTTLPGEGLFRATIRRYYLFEHIEERYYFSVTETISRINQYGNQSFSITDCLY